MHSLFRPVGKALKLTWLHTLAALVPPLCTGCHKHLPADEPVGFCPDCYARLPWWNTAQVLPPELPGGVDAFKAPCLYEGRLREVILALKFSDQTYLAAPLVKLLVPLVPEGPLLIVPVPSHRTRLRKRRYNHAALLAQALARLVKQPVDVTSLKRLKPGLPQNQKTRAQRLKMAGTDFAAGPQVAGQHVLLVDDIYTTGATARACALALKRAGAARVSVLTLAYTKPE